MGHGVNQRRRGRSPRPRNVSNSLGRRRTTGGGSGCRLEGRHGPRRADRRRVRTALACLRGESAAGARSARSRSLASGGRTTPRRVRGAPTDLRSERAAVPAVRERLGVGGPGRGSKPRRSRGRGSRSRATTRGRRSPLRRRAAPLQPALRPRRALRTGRDRKPTRRGAEHRPHRVALYAGAPAPHLRRPVATPRGRLRVAGPAARGQGQLRCARSRALG